MLTLRTASSSLDLSGTGSIRSSPSPPFCPNGGFERNRDLDKAAGAADACACPMQAASEIRGIPSLKNDRALGYDKLSREPSCQG